MGSRGVGYLSAVNNGRPVGPAWIGLFGGGFLHGILDDDGELTGDNAAFIYPDFKNALRGRFVRGKMVAARHVMVIVVLCGMKCLSCVQRYMVDISLKNSTNL